MKQVLEEQSSKAQMRMIEEELRKRGEL